MTGWLLMIGFYMNGRVYTEPAMSGIWYKTQQECMQAQSHPMVIFTYSDVLKEKGELRIWCEPSKYNSINKKGITND